MRVKITLSLFLICVIVFILQVHLYASHGISLVELYGLYPPRILDEPYRLASAIFLHGGPDHLIQNMFALLLFGSMLESILGSRRYLLVFFLAGLAGNVAGVFFYPQSYSIGASGAIMGIIGCLVVLRPFMLVWFGGPMPLILLASMWIFVDLAGLFDPYSNVGNAAHLAGMFTGGIIGRRFKQRFDEKKLVRERARREIVSDEELDEWERKWMLFVKSE